MQYESAAINHFSSRDAKIMWLAEGFSSSRCMPRYTELASNSLLRVSHCRKICIAKTTIAIRVLQVTGCAHNIEILALDCPSVGMRQRCRQKLPSKKHSASQETERRAEMRRKNDGYANMRMKRSRKTAHVTLVKPCSGRRLTSETRSSTAFSKSKNRSSERFFYNFRRLIVTGLSPPVIRSTQGLTVLSL